MSRRNYRQAAPTAGSCTNFCVNICTAVFRTGVQQCINDCLACSGETSSMLFLSDPELFDDDEDD
ncbi:MAG TPA: hypothetical protein VLK78_04110 [Candidatus Angelobacter sp.]|nr:hypothetical protein [Candidatus Angelobacter sp.]